MALLKDETGNRYGKLLVVEYAGSNGHNALWKCKCDCGNECVKLGIHLRTGHINSCGCLHKEQLINRNRRYDVIASRRLYLIWHSMIERCENAKSISYKNYGGRGISVCEEWHDFERFANWANGSGYSENLTIDRLDNDKNYCPENCKWSTMKEQGRNKRTNRMVTIGGKTCTLSEWCESYEISQVTVQSRLRYGWDIEKAITTPTKAKKKILCVETNEVFDTAREAGRKYGASKTSISMAASGATKSSCGLHWSYV